MQGSRLRSCFNALKDKNKKALIPYITAGDPSPALTVELMHSLVSSGADVIELGVPFSDPIADGPIIQRSSERALSKGVCLNDCIRWVKEFREHNKETPIVLMGYLNPIERYGIKLFAEKASFVGVDGVLIVDCPPEEATQIAECFGNNKIDLIHLVAPTTSDERIKYIAERGSGYIYYVSLRGVTGANHMDPQDVTSKLALINKSTSLPIAVGFGISSVESAVLVGKTLADGIVIGSALIKIMEESVVSGKSPIKEVSKFLCVINEALAKI
ncbi:MAG: tryptophan synthase subunit alpha [Betaproteobacteria bacterium TMED82]|nr:MAG: tryptophan synthase subunit alpha [Betaproteobacteria bacterium TMED82]|tara:strand:+ start:2207 stop:3022 length:816 start_codon:yes stop_codon:yes gene_type:complete